jgi:hypothetical protein
MMHYNFMLKMAEYKQKIEETKQDYGCTWDVPKVRYTRAMRHEIYCQENTAVCMHTT